MSKLQVQYPVEKELVYPLLQGREVERWKASPEAYIILTHRPGERLNAIPESEMAMEYPRTLIYLRNFEELLRTSGLYRRYYQDTDPFYSMFNIGDYTFAPYKVVFREIASEFTSCVVSQKESKPIIPDHKLILCPFEFPLEAHFVAALLNSKVCRYAVGAYAIETQFSTHVFDYVAIPTFVPNNSLHRHLANLSQQAHKAAAAENEEMVREIEAEIDQRAAELWGLTDGELVDIQQSLEELR